MNGRSAKLMRKIAAKKKMTPSTYRKLKVEWTRNTERQKVNFKRERIENEE